MLLTALLSAFLTLTPWVDLQRGDLCVRLCAPGTYYQGTRFDWAGVFRSVEYRGESYCDEWFDNPDPLKNDNVCGPSEEFHGCIGYDETPVGGVFLKVGVGYLVKESDAPYDWLHTYKIADGGKWNVRHTASKAVFSQNLPGNYIYRKAVELTGPDSFVIAHQLRNTGADTLKLRQYCHNLFTFGLSTVGPERMVEWDYPFAGTWREDNIHAAKDSTRIWMESTMETGQKSYIGDLTVTVPQPGGYGFTLHCGEKSVSVHSDSPMSSSVFWSSWRVFCPEPFIDIVIPPGKTHRWKVEYRFS